MNRHVDPDQFTARTTTVEVTRVESTVDPNVWADVHQLGRNHFYVVLFERDTDGVHTCGTLDSGKDNTPGFEHYVGQAVFLVDERVALRAARVP